MCDLVYLRSMQISLYHLDATADLIFKFCVTFIFSYCQYPLMEHFSM